MTELERARAHLSLRQKLLYLARKSNWHEFDVPEHEAAVLAALSWVWYEQEIVAALDRGRWDNVRPYSYEHGRLS